MGEVAPGEAIQGAPAQTVRAAGEDAVLEALIGVAGPHNESRDGAGLIVGPGGDDAALLTPSPGARLVLTTDTMNEGQDFRRSWWRGSASPGAAPYESPEEWPMDLGTKAAAQNLSDLNAMGAEPTALLISLTVPPQTTVAWVRDFYRGVVRACSAPGAERCVIAGGDLGSGETISVTITAVGELPTDVPGLRRSAAQPGDTLAVAGHLGYAAAGLTLLQRLESLTESADWKWHADRTVQHCLAAQKRPNPPLVEGRVAVISGASAGMDLSDGLLRDGARLAAASGVRVVLDDDALHRRAEQLSAAAQAAGTDTSGALDWVLSGGEDYSLLVTFPAGVELPEGFQRIGRVEAGEPGVITGLPSASTGWDSLG